MSVTSSITAARQRRSTVGAFVGTAIEWYDFYVFGTAAALVFGSVFYPDFAPGAGLIASFATFWVGFLARPIGGVIFSHFGDRFGRRNTLVVTLVLMGVGTTAIGLLPGYAQIGVVAPILLIVFRAVQGLAVGGEWGGAVVLATENARSRNRTMAGAWVQQGSPAGAILATVAFLLVSQLPDEAFMSWGWRIPFLASAVLVIVALLIRLGVEETADFESLKKKREVAKVPLVAVFRTSGSAVVFGVLASVCGIGLAYFGNTFLLAWTTGQLQMDRGAILNVILLSAVAQFIWQPFAALIARRVGDRTVLVGGLVLSIVFAVPLFLAIQSGNIVFLGIVMVLNVIGGTSYYAVLANALAQAFPPRVRYTGVSVAYQLCAMIFGGTTPLIAQWVLTVSGGNAWAVMAYYIGLIVVTIAGVIGLMRIVQRRAETPDSPPSPVDLAEEVR